MFRCLVDRKQYEGQLCLLNVRKPGNLYNCLSYTK